MKAMKRGHTLIFAPAALALALALAILAAAACGGSDNGGSQDGGNTPGGGTSTFDITEGDRMEGEALISFFDPTEVTVSAGQEVTFNFSNGGTVPHNMRIAGPDGEYNTDDDTVVDPDILQPGDKAVIEWTAPNEAGTVAFRCDFHPDSVGSITVK